MPTPQEIVRDCYRAFETADRDLIEALLAEDLEFWSPPDPGIDRKAYFERCWPGAGRVSEFDLRLLVVDGDVVISNYVATREDGSRFQNTEIHRVRDGRIDRIEVYFGWDLPST